MGVLLSGLSEEVDDNEEVCHFLTKRKQFNGDGDLLPEELLPKYDCDVNAYALSVYRDCVSDSDVLSVWKSNFKADSKPFGYFKIGVGEVRSKSLDVQAVEPPIKHANIVGWRFVENEEEQEAIQLEQALCLFSGIAANYPRSIGWKNVSFNV